MKARISGQVGYLADHGALVSVPGGAHHMDNFRRLLFKPALVLGTPRVGRSFRGFAVWALFLSRER